MKSVHVMVAAARPDTSMRYSRTNDPVWAPYFLRVYPEEADGKQGKDLTDAERHTILNQ